MGVFYSVLFFLGFAVGYWAVFVTIAAESFGTNLRATVATVVPNFVRAMVIPLTIGLTLLKPRLGLIGAALSVGCVALAIALWASVQLKETFGQDLDTLEL